MCHILFIHSKSRGHLGCSHLLVIMNNIAINIHHKSLCRCMLSLILSRCLRVEWLGHMVTVEHFEELSKCFPKVAASFFFLNQTCIMVLISSHSQWHSLLSVILIIAILVSVKWYLIVILICIFLMAKDEERLFMCLLVICISFYFFWRNVYSDLFPI
jgi:hypothetical protein